MSGSGPILVPDTEKRQMSAWGGHLSFSYFKVKKIYQITGVLSESIDL
jgi:hypothetical protein